MTSQPGRFAAGGAVSPVHSDTAPSILSELRTVGLMMNELEHIAQLENDPNSAALMKDWFESKRQVALTVAGGSLGAAIAAFVGLATVVGTANGVFSSGAQVGAVVSLAILTVAFVVLAAYCFAKVGRIADRSSQVQHILAKPGEKP